MPYDGNLTLADGKGKWWEGLDPKYLYGINLREYETVAEAANSRWSPPQAGIFSGHLEYAEWYAKWWALRTNPTTTYSNGPEPGNSTTCVRENTNNENRS